MTVTVSPVNSGPLPVRAAGNAEQQQALGHAEVGGDGVGRQLERHQFRCLNRFGSRAMFTALANKGRQAPCASRR